MRRNGHPIVAAGVVPVEEVTFVVTPLPQPQPAKASAGIVRRRAVVIQKHGVKASIAKRSPFASQPLRDRNVLALPSSLVSTLDHVTPR